MSGNIMPLVDRGNQTVYPITVTNAVMGEAGEGKLSETISALKNRISELEEVINSNPNLLDNSNFFNLVNQRSESSYTDTSSVQAAVDRWQVTSGTFTVATRTFVANDTLGTYGNQFRQYIPLDKISIGDTVTVSAVINNVRYEFTAIIPEYGTSVADSPFLLNTPWGGFKIFTQESKNATLLTMIVNVSQSITIDWIKMELGSSATPYIPKSYSEELLECQRYFYCITTTGEGKNLIFAGGCGLSGNMSQQYLPLPATLRNDSPTVSFTTDKLTLSDGNTNPIVTSIASSNQAPRAFQNGVSIFTNSTATVTSGKFYNLRLMHPGKFRVSCEI